MTEQEALNEINKYMRSKTIKSVKGEVRYLKALLSSSEDDTMIRLVRHQLKYAEKRLADEEFESFLKRKSTTLNTKVHKLTRQQVSDARREFDRL